MRRPLFAMLCVTIAGCAKPASRPTATTAPASVASVGTVAQNPAPAEPPTLAPEAALEEARARFAAASASDTYDVPEHAAELASAGLDETRTVLLLRSALAACLATPLPCDAMSVSPSSKESEEQEATVRTVRMLIEQLGAVGSDATLPFLVRLDARGVYGASNAMEQVLERRAAAARGACEPPTTVEIAAQKAALADFAVLEHNGSRWVGRAPSADEADDLAYFFVAIGEASASAGQATDKAPAVFGKRAPPNAEREKITEDMAAARMRGDVSAHARAARGYLTTLGYPGPLRGDEESRVTWGGPWYSYVMRELALSTEILGEGGEAAELYRRANPGGGGCGTSVESRRADQSRGFIRVVESGRGCRPAVPDRLYASNRGIRNEWYGPKRLADAGFDLARLYRGALLTGGRDADASEVRAALAAIPGTSGAAALARFVTRGAEEWDTRLRGLEGFADTAGKRAVPIALARAKAGPVASRTRALRVLGELGALTGPDPCKPTQLRWGFHHGSSSDERKIHALNAKCDTKLSTAELAGIVRTVTLLSSDKDPKVREGVAHTLGQIASPTSVPTLTALLADPYRIEGSTVCTSTGTGPDRCRPNLPVREAAQRALDQIAHLRKQ